MHIVDLPPTETGFASEALAEAMLDDPIFAWLIPEERARRSLLPGLMSSIITESLASDSVPTDSSRRGFAVWAREEDGVAPAQDDARPPIFAPYFSRITTLQHAQRARRPERTHLYLPVIAVLSEHQGLGLGGALLRHRLTVTDLPAYLEASSERNAALYAQHGFTPLGDPITLPHGPDLRPMWREP